MSVIVFVAIDAISLRLSQNVVVTFFPKKLTQKKKKRFKFGSFRDN